MLHVRLFLIGALLLHSIHSVQSLTCYQCVDCPQPFNEGSPYVTVSNNTNYQAQCVKTIVELSNGGRLITRGSAFSCPTTSSTNGIQIYCCNTNFCNSSVYVTPSILLILFCFMKIFL